MNILVAVEELRFGGAQTFALRLAQALHESGHQVWLYTLYANLTETELVRRLAPDVPVLAYRPALPTVDHLLQRTENWLERRGWRLNWRQQSLVRHLRKCLRDHAIDVVSSNTFKSDEVMALALSEPGLSKVPLVITMHGDYEQFWAFHQQGGAYVLPNYQQRLTQTLSRASGVVYLADQNLTVLNPAIVPPAATKHLRRRRIYNGLEGRLSSEHPRYTRQALGIPAEALIFGMVARGVAEKGWKPVLEAFAQLKAEPGLSRPVHLVLVGASPHLDELGQAYAANDHIHFLGFVNNPVDCVGAFDVGILASSLKESLPNSIAEYLYGGKAVISTEVGEIRNMLRPVLDVDAPAEANEELAGLLVPFPPAGHLASSHELYVAMRRYVAEPNLLTQHQAIAQLAFRKFDMGQCVAAYQSFYLSCQATMAPVALAIDN
jgi:glycosyltransferase involved in cell wall biosynthesis